MDSPAPTCEIFFLFFSFRSNHLICVHLETKLALKSLLANSLMHTGDRMRKTPSHWLCHRSRLHAAAGGVGVCVLLWRREQAGKQSVPENIPVTLSVLKDLTRKSCVTCSIHDGTTKLVAWDTPVLLQRLSVILGKLCHFGQAKIQMPKSSSRYLSAWKSFLVYNYSELWISAVDITLNIMVASPSTDCIKSHIFQKHHPG